MSELIPNGTEIPEEKLTKEEFIVLAKELSERHEGFLFPGIDPEAYLAIKASDAEFPECVPIDTLIEKFKKGVKVVLGPHPETGHAFILPIDSDDIDSESLFPRQLMVTEGMDESLKKLILANRK